MNCRVAIIGIMILLASCGKPDASGIYVAATDREVALIQLVQAQDGKLTGRLEASTIATDGTVTSQEAAMDGSVSGNELMLRPASGWFGGIQASGTFSRGELILTTKGYTLNADRSSLEKYRAAVAALQTNAKKQRQQIAEKNAVLASQKAQELAAKELADKEAKIGSIAASLRQYASNLNEVISRSPNFGQQAVANTARVSQLLKRANGQTNLARNQLAVAANQIEVDTNQIEVARLQYANQLDFIVDNAEQAAASLANLCDKNPTPALANVCNDANAAATKFEEVVLKGTKNFAPHKLRVQKEIRQQNALSKQI